MALVLMATHGWGTLFIDPADIEAGVGLQSSFTNPADATAATHYADDAGASPSTGPVTADANGRLVRWIEEGTYTQTLPGGATLEVQALSGSTMARVVDEKLNVEAPEFGAHPANSNAVNRAALQDAIDVAEIAPTATRKVFLPRLYETDATPLEVQGEGMIFEGPGRGTTYNPDGAAGIRSAAGDVLKIGQAGASITGLWFRDMTIESLAGGGHIFAMQSTTIDQGIAQGGGENCRLVQNNAAKSIWHQTQGLYLDMVWRDCDQHHVAGATVPAWFMTSTSGQINGARWEGGRCTYSGEFFFHVESTNAGWQILPVWRDINFEVCEGGNIKCLGVWKPIIEGCVTWDLVTSTRDLYYLGSNGASNVRYPSLHNLDRFASALGASKKDVKCHDVQGGEIVNVGGFTSPGIIDLAGVSSTDRMTLRNLTPDTVVENYTGKIASWDPPLSVTATWDPASIAAWSEERVNVTVTGAAVGDQCDVEFSTGLATANILHARVTAANTVTVAITNVSGSSNDLGSGTLYVEVRRR